MADIDLQIIAAHQATRDTRQTARRSPVPHIGHESAPSTPSRPDSPAYTAPKTVAFDVLLAAQQARTPEKVRAFDVRGAYGDKAQGHRQQTSRNADAPPQAGVFVDQSGPQPPVTPSANASSWPDNVIPLFTSAEDGTDSAAPRPQDGLSQIANRAYVNAGAFDGRAFATAGLDGRLHPAGLGFDLLI